MAKILGIDLGTSSIGLSLRNTDLGKNLKDQLEYFTSDIFKSGVGKSKTGEYSYAAERTKKRSPRHLIRSRKQRKWATLELLIENNMCPLSIEDLDKWRRYDKSKGLKREYPVGATQFEKWIRLDFNGDGVQDYSSPYQLRAELMDRQFDFNDQENLFKLGRALYHIAQRRGFRSSKGETISAQESEDIDVSDEMKKSEEKASSETKKVMEDLCLPTVGCAFAYLEKQGIRIRNSQYKAVRSQYKDEIKKIFDYQKGLNGKTELLERLTSEKKDRGTIFYKKPLKSQKGSVGKCTLEPTKSRCPISHPEFEKFRAWSFINNIQYRVSPTENWLTPSLDQKKQLFYDVFLRTKSNFDFIDIREWIEKKIINDGVKEVKHLEYSRDSKIGTINYKDNTNVSGCPISARLKNLLGADWENFKMETNEERVDKRTGSVHNISYDMTDIWHVCASFDEPEFVEQFAKEKLKFDDKQTKQMKILWGAIPEGYAMLSLKAITNINRFLTQGLIYSHAVLLAKLPDIMGDEWGNNEIQLVNSIADLIEENKRIKEIYNITNSLIADYKSLDNDDKQGFKDPTYQLQSYDFQDIDNAIEKHYGSQKWASKSEEEQLSIIESVTKLYQGFFASTQRDYYKVPKLADMLSERIRKMIPSIPESQLKKIYHPSMIEIYPMAKEQRIDGIWMKQLGSPVIGAIKNPMAMRVLHVLKNHINSLIRDNVIDEDTRIVVETARDLCDANMRAAIAAYQKQREDENKEILKILLEYNEKQKTGKTVTDLDVDRARLLLEQCELEELLAKEDYQDDSRFKKLKKEDKKTLVRFKKDMTKYKLWLEQGGICIYTNKRINIASLFSDNVVDIEHTLPRSLSFDNSLSNLTICDSHYNRDIKKNRLPSQLPDYEKILQRIEPWREKVNNLKESIAQWKKRAKRAATKDVKDDCIQQYHMYEMELEYWEKKLNSFLVKEVNSGFRNSQLIDTRIITKYAYHYLKTVFNSVDVQKGSVTAIFRKVLGVQSIDEKKSRDKHSHHAIDATMLTLIPSSAKREKILKLFYEKEELKNSKVSTKQIESELDKEIKGCNVGDVRDIASFIEDNIIINHICKDQTLTPTSKRLRSRGRIVPMKDQDGNTLYEMDGDNYVLDKYGHKIPKAKRWIKGDCIRGQLHKETFLGAITQAKRDGNTILRDENGKIITDENIRYVVRREFRFKKNDMEAGFKTWEELENSIVNTDLVKMMKSQFPEGTSFKDAFAEGIYMLDRKGNKVNKIRHVRCYTSAKNPVEVKEQTYRSTYGYKNSYYSEVGDMYVMCKYQSDDLKESSVQIYSLFDISTNRQNGLEDIPSSISGKKHDKLSLKQVLKSGDMLLIFQNDAMELRDLDNKMLSEKLYVVRGFERNGNIIKLVHHLNALEDKNLGKGESVKDYNQLPQKIRCGVNTLNFLQCGVDFDVTAQGIVFKNEIYKK